MFLQSFLFFLLAESKKVCKRSKKVVIDLFFQIYKTKNLAGFARFVSYLVSSKYVASISQVWKSGAKGNL